MENRIKRILFLAILTLAISGLAWYALPAADLGALELNVVLWGIYSANVANFLLG